MPASGKLASNQYSKNILEVFILKWKNQEAGNTAMLNFKSR
jgi:hypothetical protein